MRPIYLLALTLIGGCGSDETVEQTRPGQLEARTELLSAQFGNFSAEDSAGMTVELQYDGDGRIAQMTNQRGEVIRFTYNRDSKPVKIEQVGLGAITVTYWPDGRSREVKSDQGRQIASAHHGPRPVFVTRQDNM